MAVSKKTYLISRLGPTYRHFGKLRDFLRRERWRRHSHAGIQVGELKSGATIGTVGNGFPFARQGVRIASMRSAFEVETGVHAALSLAEAVLIV